MEAINMGVIGLNDHVPVRVKKLHPDAVIPRYARPGDAGFDLVAVEDVLIAPGESASVRTGLAFELPPGYEIQVRPRSGISSRTKLRISNAPGTIDSGYRGEVKVLFDNTEDMFTSYYDSVTNEVKLVNGDDEKINTDVPRNTYYIRKGDRIAQGVLAVVPQAIFIESANLSSSERGTGGFGSTGV
jgi:dUTP pyrophosphatase